MADRDNFILMMYRGAPEDRERAITSGSPAVEDFLGQFESPEDFAKAATLLAVALGASVHERLDEDGVQYYAKRTEGEQEFPVDAVEAAKATQGLQWLSRLTGVEALHEASLDRQRT